MVSASSFIGNEVAVVGRGPIGLAAALACAQAGLQPMLIGKPLPSETRDPWDLRVFALSPAARQLLESVGVWQGLDATRIAPVYDMRVFPAFADETGRRPIVAPAALHFSAYEAHTEALAWIVEQRNLLAALEREVHRAGLPVIEERLVAFDVRSEPQAALLTLDSGRHVRAKLVIGADGGASAVRDTAGLGWTVADYPQRALVAHFATERPHRDCAWQWFGSDGVLALLPLPALSEAATGTSGRVSIVWSAPSALAQTLQSLSPDALAARVEAACGAALGAMTSISRAEAFALRLGRVDAMCAARVALVGDAAHLVHPLAGQGMNLGFGDVAELARVLREREPGRDPGDRLLLRRYERARAVPVAAMRTLTDGLQRLFDPSSRMVPPWLRPAVDSTVAVGWRAVASSGWLKRQLIARAVG